MKGLTTGSRAIDSFQMHLADIGDADLNQLHALSIAVGWPHRAEDWQFLRQAGHGIAALDDIGRVLGSAMWFPQGETFATIGMVITSPRLQALGTAQWLMKKVMTECDGRALRLTATRAARRLYQSLDFVREQTVFQCQGEARVTAEELRAPEGADVRRLDARHVADVVDLDARAFGAPRSALIGSLFRESVGYGLFRDEELEAFALCRRFGRGHVVGPVVARTDAAAIAVVCPHVIQREGQFLRLDTRRSDGDFRTFLARSELSVFDTVLTMSFAGRPSSSALPNPDNHVTYALASQALA
jgi:GNAT superfamily N-acetyltransferase